MLELRKERRQMSDSMDSLHTALTRLEARGMPIDQQMSAAHCRMLPPHVNWL